MPIPWPDLSAYGIRLEAWEGGQQRSTAKIFYLVCFGDTTAHAEDFIRLGGRRVELFPDPKLEGFYFPMPVGDAGAQLLKGLQAAFPKMQTTVVERTEVMRPVAGRTAAVVAQAIERAKRLAIREEKIDRFAHIAQAAPAPAPTEEVVGEGARQDRDPAVGPEAAGPDVPTESEGQLQGDRKDEPSAAAPPTENPIVQVELTKPDVADSAVADVEPARSAEPAQASAIVFVAYREPSSLPDRVRHLFGAMVGHPNAPRFLAPTERDRAVYARAADGLFAGFSPGRRTPIVAICPPAVALPAPQIYEGLEVVRSDYGFALRAMEVMSPNGKAVLVLGAAERTPELRYSTHTVEFIRYIRQRYNVVDHFETGSALYDGGLGPAHQVLVIDGVIEQGAVPQDVVPAISLVDSFKGLVRRAGLIAQRWNYGQTIEARYGSEQGGNSALPNHAGLQDIVTPRAGIPGNAPGGEGVRGKLDAGALA